MRPYTIKKRVYDIFWVLCEFLHVFSLLTDFHEIMSDRPCLSIRLISEHTDGIFISSDFGGVHQDLRGNFNLVNVARMGI
jgi:hypothetical protein